MKNFLIIVACMFVGGIILSMGRELDSWALIGAGNGLGAYAGVRLFTGWRKPA